MFAYCENNPANRYDANGYVPSAIPYGSPGWFGAWLSEQILDRFKEVEEEKKRNGDVYFVPTHKGGQVKNSFIVTEWSDIYQHSSNLKQQYPEKFIGSVEGMAIEWAVHNLACYIPFLSLERAKDVDFGSTIFADAHPGFNVMMWGLYYLISPSQYRTDLKAMSVE